MSDLKENIIKEALRIEEDTNYSARSQFNASDRWKKIHYIVGIPAALMAAISGAAYFSDETICAVFLAFASTALTTLLTFLKPSEKSELHKSAGGQYLKLVVETRNFRNLELAVGMDKESAVDRIKELVGKRDEINQNSLSVGRCDYEKAKKDIETGRTTHEIDKQ